MTPILSKSEKEDITITDRVNCGVTYGLWISCHGLIKYGTHNHVTYVVMSMTGHGLIIYRVQTCHVQGYVQSYVTKNAYDVLQKTPLFFQEFQRLHDFSRATLRSLLRIYDFNILPIFITALLDSADEYHSSRLILTFLSDPEVRYIKRAEEIE